MTNTVKTLFSAVLLGLFTSALVWSAEDFEKEFRQQRLKMVNRQLRGRNIEDAKVLAAMSKVPRHRFVPDRMQVYAYDDTPLPIGHDQTISQPYIVALMTQLLKLKPGEKVLEIGTGSGYQAAVLAEMGAQVFTIEIVPELGRQAGNVLDKLGYDKVRLKIGDGYRGWPDQAPFDAVIVTCAPTAIPDPLKTQLAEGGRMAIPAGSGENQKLYLLTKKEGDVVQKEIIDVRFVPMVDSKGKTY